MDLSREEAVWFVTEILGITDQKNLSEDRLQFLNDLIKAFLRTVPFQNVTLLCQPEEERHKPTLKEIKETIMGGRGGLCYSLGVFAMHLLKALGYEAHLVSGSIRGYPDNHVIVIVENLTSPGSEHLVDAWTGWPTFQAIPLNFDNESPVYFHSFLQFKFVRESSTKVVRLHKKGSNVTYSMPKFEDSDVPDEWKKVCEVDLTPREISYFDTSMSELHTVPGARSPFLVCYRAVVYRGKDLRLVAIKNTDLLIEKDCGRKVDVRTLNSREELMDAMKTYFPQFTIEDVTKAIDSVHLWDQQKN